MNLIKFLEGNKNARKIFGERELKIIEKQVFGIALTQSEKNRLSRDIRKKFEFIKQISRFEDEFDLKKGRVIKEMIGRTVEVIKEDVLFNRVKKILLFGSSVENKRSFRSDIDIAVEFNNINVRDATKFRIRVSSKVSERIDVQVFNILPEKIKNSIQKNHKILYQKNGR